MQKVKYKIQEASKVFNDLNKFYSFSPEVKDLVESDIMSGMSKEDIKRYCSKRIPIIKMKIISECIKRDVPDDIINRMTAKTKEEDTLELIYELILEGVEVGLIGQAAPDNDRLLECLDKYKDGFKNTVKDEEVTADGLEGANRVDSGASDEVKFVSTEEKTVSEGDKPKVNVVKNVESKIVELVKEKVSEDTVAVEVTEATEDKDASGVNDKSEDKGLPRIEDNTENKTNDIEVNEPKSASESKEVSNNTNVSKVDDNTEVNSECVTTKKETGISKDEIQSLLTDLKNELVGGLVTALKEKETEKSDAGKDDLSEKIKLLQEQLYRRQLEIADRQLEIVDTRRMLYDLNEKLDQTTKIMEEKIKQSADEAIKNYKSESDENIKASVNNKESEKVETTAIADTYDNQEASKDVCTESVSELKDTKAENVGAIERPGVESIGASKSVNEKGVSTLTDVHIDRVSISSDQDSASKVVQFTNRTGDSSVITNVDFSRRKTSGLGALAATLGCKKRSRKSMMKMAISGELSKEQLIHIVEAIRAGLTEEQLCNLIENKVDAEKMPQIIEIAILENKMGYTA